MEYRILGKTGLKVSVIGVGTIPLHVPIVRGDIPAEDAKREIAKVIDGALDAGANLIDTAYLYGRGVVEEAVGTVMARRRREAIIQSRTCAHKACFRDRMPADKTVIDVTEDAINKSLERLQTDYIDIYQIHDIANEEEYREIWNSGVYDVLKKAKKAGKVGFIGASCHCTPDVIVKILEEEPDFDVITVPYNAGKQKLGLKAADMEEMENIAFPAIKKHDVGLTVMKALAGGFLTFTPDDGKKLSPSKLLRYVVQNPYVHSVTPGIKNMEELEEDIKAGDSSFALSEEEMRQIEKETKEWGPDICRQCGYCLPCPQEINIPGILRQRMMWKYKKASHVFQGYEKQEIKADACVECGICAERCPYSLPVPELLMDFHKTASEHNL